MHVSGATRGRRALLALSIAMTAGLGFGAGAQARTLVQIGGKAGPAIIPFTTTPRALNLTLDLHFSTDVPGSDPGTITKANVFFPHGPRVNGALFPSCNARTLQRAHGRRGACPSGSRIGTGSAVGTSPQFHGVLSHLRVDLYNGPGGHSILMWFHATIPISIDGLVNAQFRAIHNHKWAYELSLKVPQGLQKLGPGIYASLLRFTTHVGASVRVHGVRHGYIEALACPPGALVPVRSVFDFLDRSTASADGYVACG